MTKQRHHTERMQIIDFHLLYHHISQTYKSCSLLVIAFKKNHILIIEMQKYSSKTKQLISNICEKEN